MLFHELNRAETGAQPEAILRDVMETISAHRSTVVARLQHLAPPQLHEALSRVVATALRQPRLRRLNDWAPVSSPVMCSQVGLRVFVCGCGCVCVCV